MAAEVQVAEITEESMGAATRQRGAVREQARPKTSEKRVVYRVVKRTFDIVASLCALIALSPLFLIVAIAIRLDSKGPVVFKQQRNGLHGEIFWMYKFRSMCQDAPKLRVQLEEKNELDGPAFKIKEDPRVTLIGKFIRKTSIDELPQLWNILIGNMSFVGPRPLPIYETEKCTEYQKQRMAVKPGLTCYWQISGRSDLDFNTWVELDLKYIRERSLWVDLRTILLTIPALIRSAKKGAY